MNNITVGNASVTEAAYAKINLYLDVVGKRADGYHEIRSVMQTVSLHDTVTVTLSGRGISMTCNDSSLDCGGSNLCIRAAEAFSNAVGGIGAEIVLDKVIPIQAGLGGGSSDAAAVLRALNRICGNRLSQNDLCAIGARLGADVPFCVIGGSSLAEGVGEILSPFESLPSCAVVICKGRESVSTPEAYRRIDLLGKSPEGRFAPFAEAMRRGILFDIGRTLYNRFEDIGRSSEELKRIMIDNGACGALMSGSGSAVFGLFPNRADTESAKTALEGAGFTAFVCEPIGSVWSDRLCALN